MVNHVTFREETIALWIQEGPSWRNVTALSSSPGSVGSAAAAAPSFMSTRVIITDDFGQRVEMSLDQFQDIVTAARNGRLDQLLDHQVAQV